MITVNIKNPTTQVLENLDIQVAQTGFTIIEKKSWPEKIEAGANLSGVYILEAKTPGTHQLGLVATFAWTENKIRMQGSMTTDAGVVKVEELPLKATEQLWGGVTAVVGGVVGAVITGTAGYFRGRLEEKKNLEKQKKADEVQRHAAYDRTKSLLLSEFEINERKINKSMTAEMGNWQTIKDQGLYPIIAADRNLAKSVVDLYVDLEDYSGEVNAGRIVNYNKEALLKKLQQVYTLVDSWRFTP